MVPGRRDRARLSESLVGHLRVKTPRLLYKYGSHLPPPPGVSNRRHEFQPQRRQADAGAQLTIGHASGVGDGGARRHHDQDVAGEGIEERWPAGQRRIGAAPAARPSSAKPRTRPASSSPSARIPDIPLRRSSGAPSRPSSRAKARPSTWPPSRPPGLPRAARARRRERTGPQPVRKPGSGQERIAIYRAHGSIRHRRA